MHRTDRRQLLKGLAGLGAASSAGSRPYAAAADSPPGVMVMRISKYEIIHTRVPWAERVREPILDNYRRQNRGEPDSPHTVIKLHTDEGLVGIGEGGNEATLKSMVGHSPWEYVFNDGIGGALTAIYDLLGKATGLPVCRLLSAAPKQRILQAYWSQCYPPGLMAKEAQRGAGLGYRVHKVKIRPWEDPVAQAQAIFSATPRDYRVWGDTNHSWGSVGRTLYYARKLAEFPGYFGIESPLRGAEGYRQLKAQLPLRLAEHWGLVDPMLAAREAILDAWITASPAFGFTMFRHNAFAQQYSIPLWDESSCFSGIGLAIQAHQAAAYPGIECTIDGAVTVEDDLVKEPFSMKDGYYDIPPRPGLGVTLDDDAVEKYRVR